MHIVLEGPDNAGKSTLAERLAAELKRQVIFSEGREKHPGEINERVKRYIDTYRKTPVIFDRHPVVSQKIYSLVKANTPVDHLLEVEFYNAFPLFVYCRAKPDKGMVGHIAKAYDEADYLKTIEDTFPRLVKAYDDWALQHAHFIYRIGDNMVQFVNSIKGALNES